MTRVNLQLGVLLALVGAGLGTSALAEASLGMFQESGTELPLFGGELRAQSERKTSSATTEPPVRAARSSLEIVNPWEGSPSRASRPSASADKARASEAKAQETLRVQEVVDPWRGVVAVAPSTPPAPQLGIADPWVRGAAESASGGTYVIQEIVNPWPTR